MSEEVEKYIQRVRTAHVVQAGLEIKKSEPKEGLCPCCEEVKPDICIRRRNTAYVEESQNWIECCADCFKEDVEFFQEQWEDYYRSR